MKNILRMFGLMVGIWLCAGTAALAQSGNGRVEGSVTDSQQLALTQAQITLESASGGASQQTVTDAMGRYVFAGVAPGQYRVRARRDGFAAATKDGVAVTAGQTAIADITMGVSDVTESITVTADNDRLVASRTEIPLRELPVTVQVVNQEILAQTGATDLVRATYSIPNTNAILRWGIYEYFVFRGFGLDNTGTSSVLMDGMRLEGNRVNSQLNSIESVEILKGPASMLYGTDAVGGTINLVRKKPQSTPRYEGVLRGGRWGRFGSEFGATGPIHTDRILYRWDIGYDRADGWRDAGWRRFNTTPSFNFRLTNRDQLNVIAGYNEDRYDADAGIPLLRAPGVTNSLRANVFPDVDPSTRYNTGADFQRNRDFLPQLFYTHMFGETTRLRNAFTYRYFEDQYMTSEFLTPAGDQVNRGYLYFFHHRRPLQNQTDFVKTVKTGGIQHQLLVGYDLLYYQNVTDRSSATGAIAIPPVSLLHPVDTFTQRPASFPPSRYDYFTHNVNALYFQDFIRLRENWTFLFSGRYDHFRRNAYNNPVVNGTEGQGAITKIEQDPFTYRLASNYEFHRTVGVYASYGTSFRPQTAVSADGRQLNPETGQQVEIGQRFSLFSGRINLNTALFRIVKDNVTVSRPGGILDQAGRVRSKGFEADLRGRITARMNIRASYGFTQAQYDDFALRDGDGVIRSLAGRTPQFVPRHTVSFWGIYDLTRQWRVALGQRYLGRTPVNNFNYAIAGGYTTWDAALFFRQKKVEYSVNINNFTNKQYYWLASINDTQVFPGRPIDVTGTVRFYF